MRQLETHCLDNDPTRLGRKRSLAWKIEKNKTEKAFKFTITDCSNFVK